jgi:flagellar assembly protein FliH
VFKAGDVKGNLPSFATTLRPVEPAGNKPRVVEPEVSEELRAIREEARRQGHAEGFAAGTRKGEAAGYLLGIKRGREVGEREAHAEAVELNESKWASLAEELAELSDLNQAAFEAWAKQAEQTLLDKVVQIAEQVLCHELTLNRASLVPMVAAALREVSSAKTARVRINPFDRHLLVERQAELVALTANLRNLELVDDPSILGGAIVETDAGRVDATVTGKLISLTEQLEQQKVHAREPSQTTPESKPEAQAASPEISSPDSTGTEQKPDDPHREVA